MPILRHFLRCLLRVVLFPGVVSLPLLWFLYSVAEHMFTKWYFDMYESVWKPAFPWSWRLLFLSLFVIPAFSFLQLSWLLVLAPQWWRPRYNSHSSPSEGYIMLPRSESNSLEERERSGARDDEAADIEGSADSSRPQPPRGLFSSAWFMQFVFWLATLCITLSVGLHYQQPADLRYLSLIKNANAHPNRHGYANRGEYLSRGCIRGQLH